MSACWFVTCSLVSALAPAVSAATTVSQNYRLAHLTWRAVKWGSVFAQLRHKVSSNAASEECISWTGTQPLCHIVWNVLSCLVFVFLLALPILLSYYNCGIAITITICSTVFLCICSLISSPVICSCFFYYFLTVTLSTCPPVNSWFTKDSFIESIWLWVYI